jgi:deazaflavin-dependent oxidoreductase (nitroreductase family)
MTAAGVSSGKPITPLVHRRDGDRYIVCASKGGAPNHHQWFANVRANPEVEVEVAKDGARRRSKPVLASR